MNIKKSFNDKNFLVIGHVTESYGPVQALPDYLLNECSELTVITHPFSVSGIQNSSCSHYSSKKLVNKYEGLKCRCPELIRFFFDIAHTFYFLIILRKKFDFFIGCDCLDTSIGIILRWFNFTKRTVFYECDYTPERFKNRIMNYLYHRLNTFASRHADIVWNNPPNYTEFRTYQRSSLEKNLRVPHGVNLGEIVHPSADEINKKILVYTGHVTAAHGLQLLVDSLPKIIEKVPDISVWVIGSGPHEKTLRKNIRDQGLDSYFKFFGYTDHKLTLKYLPCCGVGVAPYVNETRGTFRYAEPLKVKDYLACGLPIIITKVPEYAFEIEKKRLGIAVDYDPVQFTEAAIKLLSDEKFYDQCKKNVLAYSLNISWDYTYDRAFAETFRRLNMEEN